MASEIDSSKIKIRDANDNDVNSLVKMARAIKEYENFNEDLFKKKLNLEGNVIKISFLDDGPLGFIEFYIDRNDKIIHINTFVFERPEVGSFLINYLVDLGKKENIDRISFTTDIDFKLSNFLKEIDFKITAKLVHWEKPLE